MGTKGIEIILNNNNRLLEENDTLQGSIEQSLKDQVSMQMLPIKTQAEDLMKEMESAIAIVAYIFNEETKTNLQHSFASIKRAVSYLESSTQSLDSLMIQEKTRIARILQYTENITANINNNGDAITNALTNISEFSDTLKTIDIANTVNEANKIITDIGLITDKINNGEGSLGLLINDDSLYNELEKASINLDKLIWDMRANPERYINIKLIDFGRDIHVIDESLLKKRDKKILEKKRKSLQ
jgi:phospholipid/cholesterol/gamma-HCH transport system substrate-binding protein